MDPTILVPLDGSSLAERAVGYAGTLAEAMKARVVLLHAPTTSVVAPGIGASLDRSVKELQARNLVVERILDPAGASGQEEVVQAILRTAEQERAGLIAMSTHGRSGIGRWIYGSVADLVLRRSTVSVLLVSPHCEPGLPAKRLNRLLVPLDGSPLAEYGLEMAAKLAEQTGANLLLLGVVDLTYFAGAEAYVPINPDIGVDEVREYLERCAAPLREQGRVVETIVEIGFPISTITNQPGKWAADLIVLATHGRGGVARVVLGSVATGVLQQAGVPLLLVRPTALTGSDAQATSASVAQPR